MAVDLGALIAIGVFACVAMIGLLLVLLVAAWALGIGRWNRRSANEAEDARIMQEIHRGLVHMEERLGSLETIMSKDDAAASAQRESHVQL